MQRPGLTVVKRATTLGVAASQDGIALLVVSALNGYVSTPYQSFVLKSLDDTAGTDINEATDEGSASLVWEHIKDFYSVAPAGTELHVLTVPAKITLKDLFIADAELESYLIAQNGRIRLIGIAVEPVEPEDHATSVPSWFSQYVLTAKTFQSKEFTAGRPIDLLIENRKFAGTATAAIDLRTYTAPGVMVISGRDKTRREALITAGNTAAANYAAVGLALGKAASIQVNQNIGRLTIPPLLQENDGLPITASEFSGGQALNDFNETDLNTLHDKGYIYIDKYVGYSGLFFVNDNTCQDATKSDSRLSLNRVANKAARITRITFLNFLKATIQVDSSTGQLLPSVVERFKDVISRAITNEMLENPDPARLPEMSGFTISIDPTQNVLSTKKIVIGISIVPTGSIDAIETIITLENPAS